MPGTTASCHAATKVPVLRLREGLRLKVPAQQKTVPPALLAPVPVPSAPQERWSTDFVHDPLFDGRPFRILTSSHFSMRDWNWTELTSGFLKIGD